MKVSPNDRLMINAIRAILGLKPLYGYERKTHLSLVDFYLSDGNKGTVGTWPLVGRT